MSASRFPPLIRVHFHRTEHVPTKQLQAAVPVSPVRPARLANHMQRTRGLARIHGQIHDQQTRGRPNPDLGPADRSFAIFNPLLHAVRNSERNTLSWTRPLASASWASIHATAHFSKSKAMVVIRPQSSSAEAFTERLTTVYASRCTLQSNLNCPAARGTRNSPQQGVLQQMRSPMSDANVFRKSRVFLDEPEPRLRLLAHQVRNH